MLDSKKRQNHVLPPILREYWAGYIDGKCTRYITPSGKHNIYINSPDEKHLRTLLPYLGDRRKIRKLKDQSFRLTIPEGSEPIALLHDKHWLRGFYDARGRTKWSATSKKIMITGLDLYFFRTAYRNVFHCMPHDYQYSGGSKSRRWSIGGHTCELFLGAIYDESVFLPEQWPKAFPRPAHLASRIIT